MTSPTGPLDLDDPRLTAFALGELDEPEAAQIQAEIASNPELGQFVNEIKATADLLSASLGREQVPGLSLEQRLSIAQAASKPSRPFLRYRQAFLSMAAALALMVGGFSAGRLTASRALQGSASVAMNTDAAVREMAPSSAPAGAFTSPIIEETFSSAAGSEPAQVEPESEMPEEQAAPPASVSSDFAPENYGALADMSRMLRTEELPQGLQDAPAAPMIASPEPTSAPGEPQNQPTFDTRLVPREAQPPPGPEGMVRGATSGPPNAKKEGDQYHFAAPALVPARPAPEQARPFDRSAGGAVMRGLDPPTTAGAVVERLTEGGIGGGMPAPGAPTGSRSAALGLEAKPGAQDEQALMLGRGGAAEGRDNLEFQRGEARARRFQTAPRDPAAMTDLEALAASPEAEVQLGQLSKLKDEKEVLAYRNQAGKTAAISPDQSLVAEVAEDQTIRVQSRQTGVNVAMLQNQTQAVDQLAISPDNRLVAVSDQQALNVWDIQTGQIVRTLRFDAGPPPAVEFGRNGELILEPNGPNTEEYDRIVDNPFHAVGDQPLSTFAVDVDTASYANVRRFLNEGQLPPPDAVRIEEMVNYFDYDYPAPSGDEPFSFSLESTRAPWSEQNRLVRVALKGRELHPKERPDSNLVFLIDVSGSMDEPNKLPLVQDSLRMLVGKLGARDRVAIVTYSTEIRTPLPATACDRKEEILAQISGLSASGGTNGGAGLEAAYAIAEQNLVEKGVNRVLLCTDGDFNVGETDRGRLTRMIEEKAKSGVYLTVLGFGTGNLKDTTLEQLADRGNGHYAYIDTASEARRVLVDHLGGTIVPIAKDVKIQVEFNPAQVAAYRLIGYENRMLQAQDFRDDRVDAGEIGAGHEVTALYEIVPAKEAEKPEPVSLRYQTARPLVQDEQLRQELLTASVRYKRPDAGPEDAVEPEINQALIDRGTDFAEASSDFQFAAAVAEFGMLLRKSPHKGSATLASALELASSARGPDPSGLRAEFLELVRKAMELTEAETK